MNFQNPGVPRTVTYQSKHKEAFRLLNLEWIKKYFWVEQKDLDQVNNPEECLNSGGQIFFVLVNDEAVGTCALYKAGPLKYELAKMAVHPDFQGKGFGDLLIETAEAWARLQNAKEILMLSNTVLSPAINLYKKHGYIVSHEGQHPDYERCNIELKKSL